MIQTHDMTPEDAAAAAKEALSRRWERSVHTDKKAGYVLVSSAEARMVQASREARRARGTHANG